MISRMLNRNQKSKPRRRRQPGQGVAPELVSWLNAGQETDRVVALLEVALRVQKVADSHGRSNTLSHKMDLSRHLEELNKCLLSFSFRPQLSTGARKTFSLSWEPPLASRRSGTLFASPTEHAESHNAMRVIRLIEQGLLSSIRKCRCDKWFVARMRKQAFCSMVCRQAAFRATELYKAKRREYMRDYYNKTMRNARRDRGYRRRTRKEVKTKCHSINGETYGG